MNAPYPKEIVHFISELLPDCMSTWATLWDRASEEGRLTLTRTDVNEELCQSYTKLINRTRRLAKQGLLDFQELNESTIFIELVGDAI